MGAGGGHFAIDLDPFFEGPGTASLPSVRSLYKLEVALGEPLNFSKFS